MYTPVSGSKILIRSGTNMNQDKDFFSIWTPRLQSLLRIVVAGLFLAHGSAKLLHFPHVAQFDSVQLTSVVGIAGLLELVGGFLLLIGLFTRPVAFILSGEMAVAYFMAHQPRALLPILNGGELAAIYSFVFLYFAVAGGGLWSLDERNRARANRLTWRTRAEAEFEQHAHDEVEHQL
jgi:putative oxidoreductase